MSALVTFRYVAPYLVLALLGVAVVAAWVRRLDAADAVWLPEPADVDDAEVSLPELRDMGRWAA